MADDGARKPWRAAKNFAEQFADRRIGFQHQEQFGRRGHAGERGIEPGERGIGIARAREGLQEQRHQFGEDFPRARAAHGGTAAEMPAPDCFGGEGRVLEAQTQQCLKRSRDRRRCP